MAAPAHSGRRNNGTPRRLDRSRQYELTDDGLNVQITDFDFAAYLLMRGVPMVSAERITDREHLFIYRNTPGGEFDAKQLAIDFVNSESSRFGDAMRRLKKTIYSARGRRR